MTSHSLQIFIQTLVTLFVLMDPIGIVPIFAALTKHQGEQEKRSTARYTALAVAGVLIISTLFGDRILSYFYIGISEFKVSGGLLLLLMSIQMLTVSNISEVFSQREDGQKTGGRLVTPPGYRQSRLMRCGRQGTVKVG